MTLRPEYSLGHSAYNDFLHAPLGRDASGIELTVLSALTRLGLDPWAEAARLADMPRAAAAQALAAAIARLPGTAPGVTLTASEAAAVAQRLVVSLPEGRAPEVPPTQEAAAAPAALAVAAVSPAASSGASSRPAAKPGATTWLLWGGIAVAFYLLIVQLTPANDLEPAGLAGGDSQSQQ